MACLVFFNMSTFPCNKIYHMPHQCSWVQMIMCAHSLVVHGNVAHFTTRERYPQSKWRVMCRVQSETFFKRIRQSFTHWHFLFLSVSLGHASFRSSLFYVCANEFLSNFLCLFSHSFVLVSRSLKIRKNIFDLKSPHFSL